jgi:pathogenesis-related protein 1
MAYDTKIDTKKMNKTVAHLSAAVVGAAVLSVAAMQVISQQTEIDLLRAAALQSATREAKHDEQIAALDVSGQVQSLEWPIKEVRLSCNAAKDATQDLLLKLEQARRATPAKPAQSKTIRAAAPRETQPPAEEPHVNPTAPVKEEPKPQIASGAVDPQQPPAPTVVASWQEQVLKEHNDWRSVVGVPPLRWSAELEQSAQQVADDLAAKGCEMKHSRTQNGENLHMSGAVKYRSGRTVHHPKTPAQIVGEWGSEADLYNYERNTCSGECGHYTQMVWRDTTSVGCAHARCGNNNDIGVCQYYPAGNVQGRKPY